MAIPNTRAKSKIPPDASSPEELAAKGNLGQVPTPPALVPRSTVKRRSWEASTGLTAENIFWEESFLYLNPDLCEQDEGYIFLCQTPIDVENFVPANMRAFWDRDALRKELKYEGKPAITYKSLVEAGFHLQNPSANDGQISTGDHGCMEANQEREGVRA